MHSRHQAIPSPLPAGVVQVHAGALLQAQRDGKAFRVALGLPPAVPLMPFEGVERREEGFASTERIPFFAA
eukprot:13434775-Heterocapsa_arctica.AAC.2